MSNLNSVFDTLRGYPYGSALEDNFEPATGATLVEGNVVKTGTRQLASAVVLRIVDDSDGGGNPPTLTAGDAGKAYEVVNWGGGYNAGDIVEWDGTDFNIIVANSGGDPPDGTRAVVVEAGGAGSFSGDEDKVMSCTGGTWSVADTPAEGNKIRITGGQYIGYYDYLSTVWRKSASQKDAPPNASVLTSGALASAPKDDAWVVIQGNDQWDASFVNRVTCLKLASGCTVQLQHDDADTLVPGTVVQANAGALEAYSNKWPVGIVIRSNGVSGADGQIVVASY